MCVPESMYAYVLLCVHVCTCLHGQTYVHTHMCMEVRGQPWKLLLFRYHLLYWVLFVCFCLCFQIEFFTGLEVIK